VSRFKRVVKYAFGHEYRTARALRFAALSSVTNAVIAAGKIALGLYTLSLFVCVNGLYNAGVALAKFFSSSSVNGRDERARRANYRRAGLLILASSAAYMAYCARMALHGDAAMVYDTTTALAIATFTFAAIGVAARGAVLDQGSRNLTLMAARRVNLVTALNTLTLTQSALMGLSESAEVVARSCGVTGIIFGAVSAVIGLRMAAKPPRQTSPP